VIVEHRAARARTEGWGGWVGGWDPRSKGHGCWCVGSCVWVLLCVHVRKGGWIPRSKGRGCWCVGICVWVLLRVHVRMGGWVDSKVKGARVLVLRCLCFI